MDINKKQMIKINKTRLVKFLIVIDLMLFCTTSSPIDNPANPDFLADFEKQCAEFDTTINSQAKNTDEIIIAYIHYKTFLNNKLNFTYNELIEKLDKNSRLSLIISQKHWDTFRKAEFDFISNTWTLENFGSSSAISRHAYQTQIIKDRIIELLNYHYNFSS